MSLNARRPEQGGMVPLLAVLVAIAAFAVLTGPVGLGPAVVACVCIAAGGWRKERVSVTRIIVFAFVAACGAYLLFVGVLNQPIPLVRGL